MKYLAISSEDLTGKTPNGRQILTVDEMHISFELHTQYIVFGLSYNTIYGVLNLV